MKAFADYIINFTFNNGVEFGSPEATSAITPYLLKRAWEQDNDKQSVLWEIGQHGTVSGDVFVKVAYEEPFKDSIGRMHPGRFRILPLNPAFSFPEWHPHDRNRLIRFKLKYKFWGCVDPETEILTQRGWKRYDEVSPEDRVLSLNPSTNTSQWEKPKSINVHEYTGGPMVRWSGQGIDALTTLNHRWLVETPHGNHVNGTFRYNREVVRSAVDIEGDRKIKDRDRLILGGGVPLSFSDHASLPNEVVETLGWFITEGCVHSNQTGYNSVLISQSDKVNPTKVGRIRELAQWWREQGATVTEREPDKNGVITWYFGKGAKEVLLSLAPNKRPPVELLTTLTLGQAVTLRETLLAADGNLNGRHVRWTQTDQYRVDFYQALAALLGVHSRYADEKVTEYCYDTKTFKTVKSERVESMGKVWCPVLSEDTGIWMARRNGVTYWTGNTSADGSRQVFTYTEIMTEDLIAAIINDEMIDSRPNPLGEIPIAYTQNIPVASSPWGLADITDLVPLNREFNEKASEVSDIINYHGAPVTVIIGAKASNLERGPKKVWAIGSKDARIENLNMETNFAGIMGYMEMLKQAMHEMTGVPATALGQMQPISNTSSAALAVQYHSLLQKYGLKKIQYNRLFKRINELVILTSVIKEPEMLMYNPFISAVQLKDNQYPQLDPNDPVTYQSTVHWPEPLPVDKLVKLNEIQGKMAIGLESKRGALRELGNAFPDQKMNDIHEEMMEDLKEQSAVNLLTAQASQFIIQATGMTPDGQPLVVPGQAGPEGEDGQPGEMVPSVNPELAQEIMMRAYASNPPEREDFDE